MAVDTPATHETTGSRTGPLEGFTYRRVRTRGAEINVATAGDGPPLVLLHGNPLTHYSWHRIAGPLARDFTIVATDLRGYGDSSKPEGGENHENYSFRAMGEDVFDVMDALGHERFQVAGHDRGARVAFRMALDRSERIERVALLDIVPTYNILTNVTKGWAKESYHWFFMAQNAPFPEKLLTADLDYYIDYKLNKKGVGLSIFSPEAMAEYKRCTTPEQIHAVCEDYRATLGIDFETDAADHGKRRIACPTLAIWGSNSHCDRHFRPAEAWGEWCDDLIAYSVPTGHYPAEHRPDLIEPAFRTFFQGGRPEAPAT
ncbi:alpha/beta fold hydrolase [Lutibaculum baratangense]|uniref:Alpha/beta hydrolase n=1 Tax=Lutibaculum baratangense AMV1 TaxID=631454 RepID=V4RSJ7_9HYPH|nr:alpha/beta hydrolase [Lutibaculum baratangense]ESR26110.1 alpha/beta hydrolase [Lutibaculum baratangense AMV1]